MTSHADITARFQALSEELAGQGIQPFAILACLYEFVADQARGEPQGQILLNCGIATFEASLYAMKNGIVIGEPVRV